MKKKTGKMILLTGVIRSRRMIQRAMFLLRRRMQKEPTSGINRIRQKNHHNSFAEDQQIGSRLRCRILRRCEPAYLPYGTMHIYTHRG